MPELIIALALIFALPVTLIALERKVPPMSKSKPDMLSVRWTERVGRKTYSGSIVADALALTAHGREETTRIIFEKAQKQLTLSRQARREPQEPDA